MATEPTLPPEEITLPAAWSKLVPAAAILGVALLAASIALGDGHQLPFSYLTAFVYWLTVALGGLFFVLVHYIARSGWSVVVRRLAEHVAATVPLFALLFVPIWLWRHELFHWTHAETVAGDPLLRHKAAYLNDGGFLLRAIVFFAVWTAVAWYYRRQSAQQDTSGDRTITRRLQKLGPLSAILFALTLAFASYDWVMSLEPHWFSTMFGPYVFAGSAVAIYSFLILLVLALQRQGPMRNLVTGEHYHDLGKMLFGFVVFWAYLGFSQFMLIWYANIPEETVWFNMRWHHGWQYVSIFLAAAHFFVPFFWLIGQPAKRSRWRLTAAAVWMMLMHWVDVYWMVMPTLHHEAFRISVLDVTCWLGVGALFLALLARLMAGPALVPVRDPRLAESLAFENV
jgi:hypothetical protein